MLEYIRSLEPTNAFLVGGAVGILFNVFIGGPFYRYWRRVIGRWADSIGIGWHDVLAITFWFLVMVGGGVLGNFLGAMFHAWYRS